MYKIYIIIGLIITTTLFILQSQAFVYLYNTEDGTNIEAFDCVYYKEKVFDQFVPFCRRVGRSSEIDRRSQTCAPNSEKHRFSDLRRKNISISELLRWSSSIEVADQYAAFLSGNLYQTDGIICECKTPSTFGKFCEYELYGYTSINEILNAQFQHKGKISNQYKDQLYGHILCYTTLECDSGLLCLDFRDICDGRQQCTDGWDEENCDKLEFNECDNDEYRCLNGMCIPQQFFLDGDYDCMDNTDEQVNDPIACGRQSASFRCDERLCNRDKFSCGNGYCIERIVRIPFQQTSSVMSCDTLREYLYQCELSRFQPLWTSKSGQCLPLIQYNIMLTEVTDYGSLSIEEKCLWLVKCALIVRQAPWCPCFSNDCAKNISHMCHQSLIIYPFGRVFNTLITVAYARNRTNWHDTKPEVFFISGRLKCRGFHLTFKKDEIGPLLMTNEYIESLQYDSYWCNFNLKLQHRNITSFASHYNLNCERNSYTFSGKPYKFDDVCEISRDCISNHRLLDKVKDCYDSFDEIMSTRIVPACLSSKHRFRCSDEQPTCYLVKELYFGTPACTNYHDIYLYGTGKPVSSFKCTSTDQSGCIDLRNYIRDHEKTASSQSTVPYVHYCDTFWDASSKIDELSINCQQWVCSSNQYQCLTGQCISVSTICNEVWDCSDASDEHGLFAIDRLSDHNRRFLNLTTLRMKCITRYPEYQQPFHTICNRSVEYPCLLANVLDPTDINTNRPCIPLSKIGDNIIDCYGGLDERNIQTSCSNNISMQHFEFRCPDSKVLECIPYNLLCKKRCLGDEPICFYRRGILNGFCSKEEEFLCLDGTCKKNVRCNHRAECSHGEDEYWCDYFAASFTIRFRALDEFLRSLIIRPNPSLVISRRLQLETFDDKIAFACNRGIAVRQLNNFVCLCPPSYYGIHCEFYSDRINFIIQLNRIQNKTLNLVALLFFNDQVIDEFDFRIYPSTKLQKHRFHLIYSRSDFYLKHKRNRYFSRDNIIYFHPYSIQFEAYELKEDESIQLIAIWNYPFYFDFLPSFRFSKILRFESFNNACLSNSCSINSTCYPILNTNTSFICQCKSGFYGKNCEYISNICISRCTPNSICRPTYRGIINGMDHPLCICPINRFGPTCHIDYNECHSQPCANNGACLSRYNPIGIHAYECQCTDYFYGDHCEYKKKLMEIHLLNITYHPLKLIIRYYDSYGPTYTFRPRIQQIYSSLPISFQYYNENVDKLSIVLLTIYEKYDNEPLYFLLAIQQNTTFINKTSSLENPCPAANSFRTIKNGKNKQFQFNLTIKSFIFFLSDPHIPTVFKYHRLCHSSNTSLSPKCFHDTNYLCICSTSNSRAECFSLPSDNCSKCLSNGRCVQDVTVNLAKEPEFLCICPRCYYGHVCEFSTLAFSFTLDSLIVQDLFKIRFVYLSIALLIFLIGLFNNICCFSTFKRRATRKVGTGNYLLIVSILSQGSILLLLLKITHILISSNNLLDNIESINIITCKTISYLLSISTRSTYWLLSLISIERLCLVIYPSATLLKKPKVAIWLSLITILIIFSMHIHEIFYYTIVKDSNNATLCAINFVQKHVLLYDRITVLFHSLGPFIIQILSISCLIVMTARSRQRTIRHRNSSFFSDHIIKQFKKQKELYLNPVVIIFSTLPQIIISFSLACTELSTSWKRYILLITYFLSFLPQMLSLILHILPSTLYNKEFHETMIYKLFIKRIFKLRHD
ncbi:unnamed protein product [Rotaria sordida]|uniref:Uncharacterized protein n=1 Tax=Rotaria sordida TaxID=392033 RepID=A0A815JJW7_9BILA|nr:unnamed protein product [Rotaria sordida]